MQQAGRLPIIEVMVVWVCPWAGGLTSRVGLSPLSSQLSLLSLPSHRHQLRSTFSLRMDNMNIPASPPRHCRDTADADELTASALEFLEKTTVSAKCYRMPIPGHLQANYLKFPFA